MMDKLCRTRYQTPYMDVIKQGQVIATMYHPLWAEVLASCEPVLPETNDLQQSPASLLTLHGADTGGGSVSLSVVARQRQMDSHNPPTGGECGLLEYDTVDVEYFSCSAIRVSSSFLTAHTSHTWQFSLFIFFYYSGAAKPSQSYCLQS